MIIGCFVIGTGSFVATVGTGSFVAGTLVTGTLVTGTLVTGTLVTGTLVTGSFVMIVGTGSFVNFGAGVGAFVIVTEGLEDDKLEGVPLGISLGKVDGSELGN